MNKQRLMVLLLAMLAVVPTVASCAEKPVDQGTASTTPAQSDAETEDPDANLSMMERRKRVKDDLPEKNYDGAQFRISTKQGYLYEIYTEEEDAEILNDALYKRNNKVEERFGVKIEPIVVNADGEHVSWVRKTISASDDAFELAATYVYTSGSLVTDGLYLNWLNMEYTDLSKPWWIDGINDKFRIGNAIYAAVGDMCVSTLMLTYGVFYNRTKGANYGDMTSGVFDKIRSGEWTIDYFIGLTKDIYEDVDGNGRKGSLDFYGFAAEPATNLDVYPFAFDIPIIENDEEGIPQLVFNTDKTVRAVELVNQLYWDGVGSYVPKASSDWGAPIQMFKNSTALFTTTWLANAFSTFRDMDDDYSILPYPKFDENQEEYLTGAMDNYSVLGVPITVKDTEMVSLITESLNVESYRTLFPTYFEQALQNKFSRDEESIEMVDLLIRGRNFDFVTLFSQNIPGMPWLFRELVASESTSFASKYKQSEKAAQAGLDKVIEAYEKHAAT